MKSFSLPMSAAVAANDLRASMYQPRAARVLIANLAFVSFAGVGATWLVSGNAPDPGALVLEVVGLAQLAALLIAVPWCSSEMLTREARRGTWDLVILSRLSSGSLAVAKYLAALGCSCFLLLVSLPVFALAAVFGTVGVGDIAAVYVALFLTAVLLCGVGLLASTERNERYKWALLAAPAVVTIALLPLTVGFPPPSAWLVDPLAVQTPVLACFSPAACLVSLLPGSAATVLPELPVWCGFALVCLAISGICLRLSEERVRLVWGRRPERAA